MSSKPTQTPAKPWYFKWPVLAAAIILVPFILIRFTNTQWQAAAPPGGQTPGSVTQTGDPQVDRELRVAQGRQDEERARVRATLLALSAKADEAARAVADLAAELGRWQAEVEPLLENDAGRRIGANPNATATFTALYRAPRPVKADADAYQSQIDALIQPVKTALQQQNFDYAPSDTLGKNLDTIKSQAAEQARKIRDARKQTQALLVDAQTSPASDVALHQAIADFDTRQARERNETVRQAEEAARKEADAKLAELRAQAVKDEAASEERKLKAEALRKKAADPTVQETYRVFLAKGRYLFTTTSPGCNVRGHQPQYSDVPGLTSFKRLRETGVLDNAMVFWATGCADANDNSPACKYGYRWQGHGNDRPVTWRGFPSSEEQATLIRKRFDEFMELAPIWVEMGLLRP